MGSLCSHKRAPQIATRPPLLACLAVAGVVRNPKLVVVSSSRLGFVKYPNNIYGYAWGLISTKIPIGVEHVSMESLTVLPVWNSLCSKERADVRFVQYVDTSVQALKVRVVFFSGPPSTSLASMV